MLLQRVITALVLLALLLPALLASSLLPFAGLTLLMLGAAGWEWGRLNGLGQAGALGLGAAVALTCSAAWVAGWAEAAPSVVWWLACACWVAGSAWALRAGPSAWPQLPQAARLLLGWLVLSVAWLALAAAKQRGLGFILSSLCLVWAADIAAYFGGKAFGRRKLAPSISPGKTWEGALGGALGALLLALLWSSWIDRALPVDAPSLFSMLQERGGVAWMLAATAALAALSVVGDLFESLVKRAAGAKDSSRLLPGHGGVLDRIDALLPVLPAALALRAL
jgi:phosphatidate cytidylyltransferase